jgi:hypothetical protein
METPPAGRDNLAKCLDPDRMVLARAGDFRVAAKL